MLRTVLPARVYRVMLQDIVCAAAAENMTVFTNWLAFQQIGLLCLVAAMV